MRGWRSHFAAVLTALVEINDDSGSCLVNTSHEIDLMISLRHNRLVDTDRVDPRNPVSFTAPEALESCMTVGRDAYFGDWFGA